MRYWAAALGCLICAAPSLAAGAPPKAIWGKSFVVSAEQTRHQRVLPDGDWIDRQLSRTVELYVSSTGRVFKRERVVAYTGAMDSGPGGRGTRGAKGGGVRSGSKDVVGGDEGSSRLNAAFTSNAILITTLAERGQGARQTSIQFDEGGQSCQATMLQGKGAGSGSYVIRSLINGREVEIQSVNTGSASCKVVDGNVFE